MVEDRAGSHPRPTAKPSFAHLHTHTEFSMLDGAARIPDLVAAALEDGQPALAITDHGNMYGVLDFYKHCRAQGITPIIGTEAYMAANSRLDRPVRRGRVDDTGGDGDRGEKLYYHLTVLAETNTGYRNLVKLSSAAYLEGYYYKPRVDWEMLERYHEGLIATTGCLGGVVLQALLAGDEQKAKALAGRLQDIFGRESLFVELQDQGLPAQRRTNPQLVEIARSLDAPLLATNDSHYCRRADADAHDALLCVQTGAVRSDPNRFHFEGQEHYLKTAGEMRRLFADHEDACDNTLLIAERASVEIELGKPALPRFPLPAEFAASSYEEGAARIPPAPDRLGGPRQVRPHSPRARRRADGVRARGDRRDGFLGLFPRGVGPDPLRPHPRHPRRPRAWLGCRLPRRLLPADRRPRPDPLRPFVRAFPQPGPQADA